MNPSLPGMDVSAVEQLVDEQDLHGYEIGRLIELRSAGTLDEC